MLPEQELQELLAHSDPKVAAAAKKLKDLRDKGEYLPKSKFDEVNSSKLELKKQLDDALAAVTAAEARINAAVGDKDKTNQETLRQLTEAQKKLEASLKVQESLKPSADRYEELRQVRLTVLKEKSGDRFLPEYEGFSVESLEKLIGQFGETKVDIDAGKPGTKVGTSKPVTGMTDAEIAEMNTRVKRGEVIKPGQPAASQV